MPGELYAHSGYTHSLQQCRVGIRDTRAPLEKQSLNLSTTTSEDTGHIRSSGKKRAKEDRIGDG